VGSLLEAVSDQITPRAAALVLIAMAVTAATFGSRWLLLQRALQRRERVCQLLPTDTFDPSAEDIVQHAQTVLSRVHRVTRSLAAQRANAVRIRLEVVDDVVVYLVEGPSRARSLLRRSGYREVEVVLAPNVDGTEPPDTVSDLAATPPQAQQANDPTPALGGGGVSG
jgi:CRP-like cAMP-binding protein